MARFRIDQGDTGPVGQSRHDLVEGQEITLEVIDPLPGATYYWELIDHVGAPGATLTANGTTATIGPAGEITSPCTFLIRLYGDGHTEERVASVRAESGVRYPAYGEKAPKDATLGNHDPDDSTDNAWYPDLAGHGPGQNWAGWREWAREMVDAVDAASNQESDRLESDSGDAFVVASDELDFTEGPGAMLGWSGEILGTQMFAAAIAGRTEDNHPYVGLIAGDPESENNSSSLLVLPDGIFTREGELATQLYVDERAGHTITGVSIDWTDPEEPVPVFTDYPKRSKLIITTDTFEADVQDMEEIDATLILLPSSGGGGSSTTLEDSYGSSFAQIRVTADLESGWGDDFPTLGQGSVGHLTRIDGVYSLNTDHHASLRGYGGYNPGSDRLVSSTRLRHWDQSDPLGGEQHVVSNMQSQAGNATIHLAAYNFRGDEPYSSRWQREMATTYLQVTASGTAANTLSVVDEGVELAGVRAVLKKDGDDAHPGRLVLFDQEAGELDLKDLATKTYADSRPGAEEWSEHPATQDVDLDGHKITGLGEPTDAADAATKAYVDAQSGGGGGGTPDRIESASGEAFVESTDDFEGYGAPASIMRAKSNVASAQVVTEVHPNISVASVSAGGEDNIGGDVGFAALYEPSTGVRELRADGAPLEIEEPVESSHAATKGYVDDRLPELEWWDPTWMPVSNVDAAVNRECSYTRTYHASGGSLVTIEGTVRVTPEAAGQLTVRTGLPVERIGSEWLVGPAVAYKTSDFGHITAYASVDVNQRLTLGFIADGDDPCLIGFRISYRAE